MERTTWQHIRRGCGTLPICGDHPGWSSIIGFAIVGAGIGFTVNGIIGGLAGCGFILATLGPLFLYGAYERSKFEDNK